MNESQIFRKITQLHIQINTYRNSLNTEAVWLFLSILGCWSVTQIHLQIAALIITAILFTLRVFQAMPVKMTFDGMIKEIKGTISSTTAIPEERKHFFLNEVKNIELSELSYKKSLMSVPIFILCYGFFGATVLYLFFNN